MFDDTDKWTNPVIYVVLALSLMVAGTAIEKHLDHFIGGPTESSELIR